MAQNLEIIETERLLLRGINESDAELIVKWRSEPDVYKYFKAPHKITVDEHLYWYHNRYLSNENRFDWICIEKKSEQRIGVFGLYKEDYKSEVNYILAPEAQHKGYATEAIQKLIQYAADIWNSKKIIAEIHKDNKQSIILAERLGFVLIYSDDPFVIYEKEVNNIDTYKS